MQFGYLVFSHSRNIDPYSSSLLSLFYKTFGQIVPLHIFGQSFLTATAWFLIFGILVFAVSVNAAAKPEARVKMLMFMGIAVLLAMAGTLAGGLDGTQSFGFSDRYFYFVKLVFWWAVTFSLSRHGHMRQQQPALMVVGAMIFVAVLNGSYMQRHALQDMDWKTQGKLLSQPGYHEIPINPSWTLKVTTESKEKSHE